MNRTLQAVPAVAEVVRTPIADRLAELRKGAGRSFHALPLSAGASVVSCRWREKYDELFGQEFLKSDVTITGKHFDSLFFAKNVIKDAENGARLYRLEDAIRGLSCVADVALLQRDDTNIDCALVIRDAILEPQEIHERVRQLAQREQLAVARYRDVPQIPYSPTGKIRIRDVASYFNA